MSGHGSDHPPSPPDAAGPPRSFGTAGYRSPSGGQNFRNRWGQNFRNPQRSALARAVGTDDPKDASLLDAQVDSIQGDGGAEGLAETVCFDAWHGFSAPSWRDSTTACRARRDSGVPPHSDRAGGWLRGSRASARQETSG